MIEDSKTFDGIIDAIEPVYEQLLDLVPMDDRAKVKTRKSILKFILDETKRAALMRMDLIDPFRVVEVKEEHDPKSGWSGVSVGNNYDD